MSTINAVLRPAWRNYWAGFVVVGLLLFVTLAVAAGSTGDAGRLGAGIWFLAALLVLGFVVFKRFSWKFSIDENRVSRQYGIISRNQQSVRIRDLRSIELDQSLFQRIFGVGDLAFYSAGSANAEVKFFGISKPLEWRDRIDNAVDHLKKSND